MPLWIEIEDTAGRSITRTRHRPGKRNRPTEFLSPIREVEGVKPLDVTWIRDRTFLCLPDNVESAGGSVDNWSSRDANLRNDVSTTQVAIWDRCRARGGSVSGVQKSDFPKGRRIRSAVRIGVKRINAVVLRGDENDVVNSFAGDRHVWNVERLCVNPAVNRVREQFAEGGLIDIGGCQNSFGGICACAGVIVVLCQDRSLRRGSRRQQ